MAAEQTRLLFIVLRKKKPLVPALTLLPTLQYTKLHWAAGVPKQTKATLGSLKEPSFQMPTLHYSCLHFLYVSLVLLRQKSWQSWACLLCQFYHTSAERGSNCPIHSLSEILESDMKLQVMFFSLSNIPGVTICLLLFVPSTDHWDCLDCSAELLENPLQIFMLFLVHLKIHEYSHA